MKNLKVVSIQENGLTFESGIELFSAHTQDCCEEHYLSFEHISLSDFEGLEFDFTNNEFFTRIKGFGISLNPVNGFPVRIPGYGSNNGYYSSYLELIVSQYGFEWKRFNITECQDYEEETY